MDHTLTLDHDGTPVERSDMVLVALTRTGDKDAFGELWKRHYHAALRAARAISFNHDAEDLVQEAFTRIYQAILQGSGPKEVFRAYLYTALRSVSMNWSRNENYDSSLEELPAAAEPAYTFEGQVVSESITARAFATLKPQWRAVLWYLDVEEMAPREAAPLLGLGANATSALANRAREALRSAWLQAHLNSENADIKCKWTVERLGAYNRGTLPARERNPLQEHLTTCLKCSILVEEVDHISKNLSIFLLPIVVGPAAFSLMEDIGQGTMPSGPVPPNPLAGQLAGASKLGLGLIASALTATGLIAVVMLLSTPTPDSSTTGAEPATSISPQTPPTSNDKASAPAKTAPQKPEEKPPTSPAVQPGIKSDPQPEAASNLADQPVLDLTPVPTTTQLPPMPSTAVKPLASGTPTRNPQPKPTVPPQAEPTPTSPSTPTPNAPAVPAVLAVPNIDTVTEQGLYLPLLKGTGLPGATITVLSANKTVGSALVTATGAWSLVPDLTMTSSAPVSFSAYQTINGLVSASSPTTAAITLATPEISSIQYSEGLGNVLLSGPAGSIVEVVIDGTPTGNLHTMDGGRILRRLPALPPGSHSIVVRFLEPATAQRSASYATEFKVPITGRATVPVPPDGTKPA